MEISEKEYYELKEQVRILQEKVGGLPKKTSSFAELVNEHPIEYVMNSVEDYPDFMYRRHLSDTWKVFSCLAKMVHSSSYKFYMGTTGQHLPRPYIRTIGKNETPRKITDLTNEQLEISVQMLNELIPIYNRYFKQTHEYVLYTDSDDGQYRRIYIEKEMDSE